MSELVALFEDSAHESLLRHLLRRVYGLDQRKVRYRRCVDCVGVERALVGEVRNLRSKNYQMSRALLVVIDADHLGVDGRKRRLDELLTDAGLEPRNASERIAYVVPRLEAENWYIHFCCPGRRPVREDLDFKQDKDWRRLKEDLGAAARQLAKTWRSPVPGEPPSIVDARREFARVLA